MPSIHLHHPMIASPALRHKRLAAAAGAPAYDASRPAGIAAVPERLPRLPGELLARPRLAQRLDCWAPVTLVRAIAGSGKTTLIGSWLAAQSDDVVPLWLATGLVGAVADVHWLLDLTMDAAGLVQPGRADTTASGALGRLHDTLLAASTERPIVLVLDAADAVTDRGLLAGLLGLVERHRHFHLIVCSRGVHPIESMTAQLSTITTTDLLLDRAELAELALAAGRRLPERELTRLLDATGGWLAVVRLILSAMTGDSIPLAAANRYLKSTLLADLADPARRDLLRFALAERLDTRLIADLSDDQDPDEIVAALERSGLVERCYEGDTVVLRYPSLVRDTLQAAYSSCDPGAARAFHGRLAEWYGSRPGAQQALLALGHAVASQDWALVGRLSDQHGLSLAVTDPQALRATLTAVPREVLDRYPGLGLSLASLAGDEAGDEAEAGDQRHIDFGMDRDAGCRAYVRGSHRLLERAGSHLSAPDLLYAGAGRLLGLRAQNRLDDAVEFAATVKARLRAHGEASAPPERLAWFHLQLALTHTLRGADAAALRDYERAWDFAVAAGADVIAAPACANVALTHALRGNAAEAASWLRRYDGLAGRQGFDERSAGVGALIATVLLATDGLDEPAATDALTRLDAASAGELWTFAAYAHSQHALHFGDPAATLAKLAGWSSPSSPYLAHLLNRARADLLIAQGDGQRARALVGNDVDPLLVVSLVRLHLLAGDDNQARNVAVRASLAGETSPRDQVELRLLQAVAALGLGELDGARQLFAQVVELHAERRIPRVFTTIAMDQLARLRGLCDSTIVLDERLPGARAPIYANPVVLIWLTKSERSLIEALETTGSRREIAETRFVSLNTVKTQMRSLYHKLGTTSRDDTLTRVRELGLV